jgi:hypothetical protein
MELLAIPLGDQRTAAKWLVNESHEINSCIFFVYFVSFVDPVLHLQ